MRIVSLDHLTVFELTPPELVRTAAQAGFRHVGMRLSPAAPGERQHPMIGDTPMRRETLAAMREHGVAVFDVGVIRLRKEMDLPGCEPVLECAARLGAGHVVVNGDEPDPAILAELLARLCALGRPYGLTMNLEPTPWTGVRTPAEATRVVQDARCAEARVLVDTIHVDRCGATAADLERLPPSLLAYVQLCDAHGPRPADFETMIYQARNARGFPGEGNLDLRAMLAALPRGIPVSLEAPTRSPGEAPTALQRAQRGRAAVEALLAAVDGNAKPDVGAPG